MEITILDPDPDQEGKYTQGFISFISAFLHTWEKALNETGRNRLKRCSGRRIIISA